MIRSRIRSDHPLNHLFTDLVERHLVRFAGVGDREMARYIAALLVDFTHVDHLYRIRNSAGRRLEQVGEMLLESNPFAGGESFSREREVRKHIGDYTLFTTGIFPEHVSRLPSRGLKADALIDYMQTGKKSYEIVASFDGGGFRESASLFRRLSKQFELCVFGLNLVKQELELNQRDWYRGLLATLQ